MATWCVNDLIFTNRRPFSFFLFFPLSFFLTCFYLVFDFQTRIPSFTLISFLFLYVFDFPSFYLLSFIALSLSFFFLSLISLFTLFFIFHSSFFLLCFSTFIHLSFYLVFHFSFISFVTCCVLFEALWL